MISLYFFVIFATVLVLYIKTFNHRKGSPPGPKPLPVLGNLLDIAKASNNPLRAFSILGKKYGEIFSVKIGFRANAVILTSKQAITDVLSNEAVFGRDRTGIMSDRAYGKNLGVAMSDGEIWEKSRLWSLRNLREFGFAKSTHMETCIQDCCSLLFKEMNQKGIKTDSVQLVNHKFFSPTILKIMWQMLFGPVTPDHERDLKIVAEKLEGLTSGSFSSGLIVFYPPLRHFFKNLSGYAAQLDFCRTSEGILKKLYHSETTAKKDNSQQPQHLTEAFARNVGTDSMVFNCENYQVMFQDLIIGSTDTTSAFMESVVLYLCLHQNVQELIYREVVAAGSPFSKPLCYEDKKKMPYTQAFFLEVHRFATILPNLLPRVALRDAKYKDYVIRKGTLVMADLYSHNHDVNVWGDPENFRPERFLSDGKLCDKLKREVIPFSVGKRNCIGELYANVQTFLMTTLLVQTYAISPAQGYPKPTEGFTVSMVCRPKPFFVKFQLRQ